MSAPVATLATWNVEWARAGSPRGRAVRARLEALDAHVLCVTEGFSDLVPEHGYVIETDADYGYPIRPGRRKGLLWSREPWSEVDPVGDAAMPGGRFVAGVTSTPIGRLRVMCVCIPWSMAHVATGRRDRSRWEDHLAYLEGLARVVRHDAGDVPAIVLGDFNQRMPASNGRPPRRVAEALTASLAGLDVPTRGSVPGVDGQLIDHIALGPGLVAKEVRAWPPELEGVRLSDHAGVVASVTGRVASPLRDPLTGIGHLGGLAGADVSTHDRLP